MYLYFVKIVNTNQIEVILEIVNENMVIIWRFSVLADFDDFEICWKTRPFE